MPVYKREESKLECRNYRDISMQSIPGKMYGRIIIQTVMTETEEVFGEEQCSLKHSKKY